MRSDRGFTLMEVLVALTVGALVILMAERLFVTVSDGARALAGARQALDREANARRWLAATFLSAEVGPDAGAFEGESTVVVFSTWQQTPGAWFERRRVTLCSAAGRFLAVVAPRDTVALADSVTSLGVDYLLHSGADARWLDAWVSGTSAPVAVRLRIASAARVDTLLFLIKDRG